MEWTAEAYEVEYPELKLLGWRELGELNAQEKIDNFLKEGVHKDKLYCHPIDIQTKKYEIAPLSELMQKYDV